VGFDFATCGRILFGAGTTKKVPAIVRELGRRALIVTGGDPCRAQSVVAGLDCEWFAVWGEPTVPIVRQGVALARKAGCDVVVSIGGGSAIDAGKAIAILATNSGEPLDYLEVVGRGQAFLRPGHPFIAIPTTAGTGSEVTRNSVLGSPEHGVKASLRSAWMLARVAVVDPELAYSMPPAVTVSTGLDALTQLIEPYVSIRANAMTDLYCAEGIRRVAAALRVAVEDGSNAAARESMSWASLLGGLSLANAGLGVVHGFAAPIGGMADAAHGAVCAAILPHGMAMNIRALSERDPRGPGLGRYRDVARWLTGNPAAGPGDGVRFVRELCSALGVPGLAELGVRSEQHAELVAKAARASSMKANPIVLTGDELAEIMNAAAGPESRPT
jgi:alcohol dehydrogenase class IV